MNPPPPTINGFHSNSTNEQPQDIIRFFKFEASVLFQEVKLLEWVVFSLLKVLFMSSLKIALGYCKSMDTNMQQRLRDYIKGLCYEGYLHIQEYTFKGARLPFMGTNKI